MTWDLTILINSCDKYEDLWYPFFTLLEKNWNPISYPIVLNTESKTYNQSVSGKKVKSFQLFPSKKRIPWGKRLIDTLNCIDTDFILFMLDDFFLEEPVDLNRIESIIDYMKADPTIACFSFAHQLPPNINDGLYPGFERRPQNGDYRFTCQAGIWRREKLISYIRPHESPWDWEKYGSIRSEKYSEKFYSGIAGFPAVMVYDVVSGGGVHCGKWTQNVVNLFKENNIEIDFSKRGFFGEIEEDKKNKGIIIKNYHRIKNRLQRKYAVWKSLR